jgi:microcystin-dependent protein
MMTGFNFAQRGFAFCYGATLPIAQNQALFSLLGVNYGGNGVTTFNLPQLAGEVPVGCGASVDPSWQPAPYNIGTTAGSETVTLQTTQLATHTHIANATTATGARAQPNTLFGAASNGTKLYGALGAPVPLAPQTLGSAGNNQPHDNMQPYLGINFNIALQGIFPSRG